MQYHWVTGTVLILALLFFVISTVALTRRGWFLAWLKGSVSILLLLFSFFLVVVALNFYSFRQTSDIVSVATVSFERVSKQNYRATVSSSAGRERSFNILGDLWQLDARAFKWSGLLANLGIKTGYKLDKIQGRYLSLEQEVSATREVFTLSEPEIGFDLWSYLNTKGSWLPWLTASMVSATYLPMADAAVFTVRMGPSALIAIPSNDRAEKAIEAWN